MLSSMRAISAAESLTRNAANDSESCLRVRAPITGTIRRPFASTQAMASCAGVRQGGLIEDIHRNATAFRGKLGHNAFPMADAWFGMPHTLDDRHAVAFND